MPFFGDAEYPQDAPRFYPEGWKILLDFNIFFTSIVVYLYILEDCFYRITTTEVKMRGFILSNLVILMAFFGCGEDKTTEPDYNMGEGRLVFVSERDGNMEIYTMNIDGTNQQNISNHPSNDNFPCWSSDGAKIAFGSYRDADSGGVAGNWEIYTMNADGSNQQNITNNSAYDNHPYWSPDGTQIVYNSGSQGYPDGIYVMNADGSGRHRLPGEEWGSYPRWSPDGSKISFVKYLDGRNQIFIMNADGSNPHSVSYSDRYDEYPCWSPDGTRIAFRSDRAGSDDSEIWVMDIDGSNRTNITNRDGDDNRPWWSPSGSHICFVSYRDGNAQIYVMDAQGTNQINISSNDWEDTYVMWSSDGS
jgi:Tol biopolymer transport system component